MQSRLVLLVPFVWLGATGCGLLAGLGDFKDASGSATGGSGGATATGGGGAGGGTGGAPACLENKDCVADPCTAGTCSDGVCTFESSPAGEPCGDALQCDGEGHCVGCLTAAECPGIAGCSAQGVCEDKVQWSMRWGDGLDQSLTSLSAGADGHLFLGGLFRGTLDFGQMSSVSSTAEDHTDLFFARFDPSGMPTWGRSFGNGTYDQGFKAGLITRGAEIAAHPDGGAVIGSQILGAVDFDATPLTAATNWPDIVVAKLDEMGAVTWANVFGPADNNTNVKEIIHLGVSAGGTTHIAGGLKSALTFPPKPAVTSTGAEDMLFALLDNDGTAIGVKSFGSTGADPLLQYDFAYAAAPTTDNSWVIAGSAGGPIDFGKGPVGEGLPDTPAACAAKLDGNLNCTWSDCTGVASTGNAWFKIVPVGTDAILVGRRNGTATQSELAVQKMAKFGGVLFSNHWGGGPNNSIASRPVATLTDRSTILIASSFIGSLDLGVRVLDGNAAVPTGFLLELDLDGNPLWAASFGQDVLPNGVVSVGEGKVVVGGVLKGSLGLLAGDPQPSNGGSDVFLFEIALP